MYINSPGGSVTAGLAIYDTMQFVKPPVSTCAWAGDEYGRGAAGGGRQGQALRAAELADHDPPALGQLRRPGDRYRDSGAEALRLREILNNILDHHSGQPLKRIEKDTDRDFFMQRGAGVEYGLIDEVIANRAGKAGGNHPKPNEHPKFPSLAVGGSPFRI